MVGGLKAFNMIIELVGLTQIDWTKLIEFFSREAGEQVTKSIDNSKLTFTPSGAWLKVISDSFAQHTDGKFLGYLAMTINEEQIYALARCGVHSLRLKKLDSGYLALYAESVEKWRDTVVMLCDKEYPILNEIGTKIYAKLEPLSRELYKDLSFRKTKKEWLCLN